MSFVELVEDIIPEGQPNPTEDHDPSHESIHRLHNARGRVYFTADRAFDESAPGARDGGAKGNGVDDDTNAINAAITLCNTEGGGEVVLTGQEGDTFVVSKYTDPSNVAHAGCVWMLSNVTLTGRGRGVSVLFLADGQADFIRPISGPTAQTNVEVRNLQIDGNQANQPQGNNVNEHAAGIFLDAWVDALIENVDVHDTRGDGIHVATSTTTNSLRPVIRGVRVHAVVRVGINLNRAVQAEVSGCHIYGMIGGNCIKCEVDNELNSITNPYYAIDGCTITGCTLDGTSGSTVSGCVLSGSSATTRVRDIVFSQNNIIGCEPGISLGVYGSDGFNVSDNNFRACSRAVTITSYSTVQGYAAHVGVVVCNNVIRDSTSVLATEYQIDLANATDVSVRGNTITSAVSISGVRLQQCTEFSVDFADVTLGGAGGTACSIYRSYNGQITGGKATHSGAAARAVVITLDSAFPLGPISVGPITHITGGTASSAVLLSADSSDTTALNSHTVAFVGLIHADCTGPAIAGADDGRSAFPHLARHTFGGMKRSYGTVIPTSDTTAQTWARGDTRENTSKTELGTAGAKYVLWGWACTSPGTPGTWKEMRMLTGG